MKICFFKIEDKKDIPQYKYYEVNSSYPGAKNFKLNFIKKNVVKFLDIS